MAWCEDLKQRKKDIGVKIAEIGQVVATIEKKSLNYSEEELHEHIVEVLKRLGIDSLNYSKEKSCE